MSNPDQDRFDVASVKQLTGGDRITARLISSAPARPTTVSDVLDAAADHLQQHGWYQGDLEGPNGACCTHGAFNVVMYGKANPDVFEEFDSFDSPEEQAAAAARQRTYKAARNQLSNFLDDSGALDDMADNAFQDEIAWWNDRPGRTADEVIATLRRVAGQQRQAASVGGA